MKCYRVKELVSEALDGTLGEKEGAEFRGHLDDCPPCRAFYAEVRESLLLLNELPTIEVGEDFDAAVWQRVRALETSRGIRELVRERAAEYWGRLTFRSIARWSPVGVAAGVLWMIAIAPEPPVSGGDEGTRAAAVVERETAGPGEVGEVEVAAVEETAPEMGPSLPPGSGFEPSVPEEVVAGIPEAVEAYLRNARDLRLSGDSDRYRRSNYSYPLRRVEAGTPRPVPVSTPSSEPHVTVIAF